jgi:hypothetical protein
LSYIDASFYAAKINTVLSNTLFHDATIIVRYGMLLYRTVTVLLGSCIDTILCNIMLYILPYQGLLQFHDTLLRYNRYGKHYALYTSITVRYGTVVYYTVPHINGKLLDYRE